MNPNHAPHSRHRPTVRRLLADDTGSTTITAAFLAAAIVALAMVGVHAGAGLVEQRRTQNAADLAAVAGAVDGQRGGAACDVAADIAARNGAELAGCHRDGEDVQVTAVRGERDAVARAGPSESG